MLAIPYTEEEKRLIDFVDSNAFGLREDFGTRFERTLQALSKLGMSQETSESSGRDHLNEALHTRAISQLRSLLGPILKGRRRVGVVLDILDEDCGGTLATL